jgi:plasmid stabilization system protein ParE
MRIRWSHSASKDLVRIFDRIAKDKPDAARRVIQTIYDGCATLERFPDRGRIGRVNRLSKSRASITERRIGPDLVFLRTGVGSRNCSGHRCERSGEAERSGDASTYSHTLRNKVEHDRARGDVVIRERRAELDGVARRRVESQRLAVGRNLELA